MENWFPEFTWEHVSRKLAEVGFKRSADKCKEKFEEESRHINNISFTKNYRFLTGLEELYQAGGGGGGGRGGGGGGGNDHHQTPSQQLKVEKASANNEGDSREKECRISDEDNGGSKGVEEEESEKEAAVAATAAVVGRAKSGDGDNLKKRKRQRRFDMLKGFCEDIVERMMAQQEEMHTMLLEEMVKRNEEKLAREEAWKKNEIDRMNKELEIMAHEQAIAGDRQATIINFLNKFTSSTSSLSTTTTTTTALLSNPNQNYVDGKEVEVPATSSPAIHQNNPTTPSSVTETTPAPQSPSSSTLNPKTTLPLENPSSGTPAPQNPSSVDNVEEKKHDLGKRWPRDEVLALINLRCSLSNNGGVSSSDNQQDGGGSSSSTTVKAPLWERISQGMLERGYKRSAKRCKEKWENINKYFRKTKDVNKKRSLDSRTCPYFHQLSTLYNEGILMPPSDTQLPENQPLSSPAAPETDHRSNAEEDNVGDSTKHEKNNMEVQVEPVVGAAFEFDF